MSNFEDYALQYVLTEEEPRRKLAVAKAAQEITDSRGSTNVVFKWAESIKLWMPKADTDDLVDDGEEAEGQGDIIARSKALDFLARTLELLDESVLRPDQVKMLVAFFGAMFGIDHKAGIAPSAKALQHLTQTKAFKPVQGVDIVDHLVKMGDDFRLQAPLTRLQVYQLLKRLLDDEAIRSELQFKHGSTCGFIADLLDMCKHERDPRNLLLWFDIIKSLLTGLEPSDDISKEIFKIVSAYFPISLRPAATPTGITADDLKASLRGCLCAHYRIAGHVFPFLIQKLDLGDAITATVKVDILQTIDACLSSYEHVQKSIVPSVEKIWTSLKYEVRNGEVEDTIQGTLKVMRTLTARLSGDSLKAFTQLILRDCLDDVGNPTYTLPSGKLLASAYGSTPAAYGIVVPTLMPHIKMNLRQPKSPAHTQDLITVQNSVLSARSELLSNTDEKTASGLSVMDSASSHISTLFDDVYFPHFQDCVNGKDTGNNQAAILKEVVKGLALIVEQETVEASPAARSLLSPPSTCSKISSLLSPVILDSPLTRFDERKQPELEDEVVLALRRIATSYAPAFVDLLDRSKPMLKGTFDEHSLKLLTTRLAFIGCSQVPRRVGNFHHFLCLSSVFLGEINSALDADTVPYVASTLVAAIHCSILSFEEALEASQTDFKAGSLEMTWHSDVVSRHPNVPRIDEAILGDWKIAGGSQGPVSDTEFSRLCLFIVRQLYRRVTQVSSGATQGPLALSPELKRNPEFLGYLSRMATFVIGELSAADQSKISCFAEVLCLFRGGDTYAGLPLNKYQLQPVTTTLGTDTLILSQGIFQGLWPAAMDGMYDNDLAYKLLSQQLNQTDTLEPQHQRAHNTITTILANKYDRKHPTWPTLVDLATSKLDDLLSPATSSPATSSSGTTTLQSLRTILAFTAGALPNYDPKTLPKLLKTLSLLPTHTTLGLPASRLLSTLLSPKPELLTPHHPRLKLLWRQWTYTQLIRPMFPSAFPLSQTPREQARNYAVAVMQLLRHLPLETYVSDSDGEGGEDAEMVARMAIPGLTHLPVGLDVEVAAKILISLLESKSGVLKDRVNAVVKAGMQLLVRASTTATTTTSTTATTSSSAATTTTTTSTTTTVAEGEETSKSTPATKVSTAAAATCRKLALQILAWLPVKFKERQLREHAPKMRRMLWEACGDPVREVRQAAVRARVKWVDVGVEVESS